MATHRARGATALRPLHRPPDRRLTKRKKPLGAVDAERVRERRHSLDRHARLALLEHGDQVRAVVAQLVRVWRRVHIAFHGCQQDREVLRELYATRTGCNRWADTNGLVILYSQAIRTPANP